MADFTEEEKIDYIFKELKFQKKSRYFKWFFKIMMLLVLIYGYFYIIPKLDKDKFFGVISDNMVDFVRPITENLVNDMLERETEKAKDSTKAISDALRDKIFVK